VIDLFLDPVLVPGDMRHRLVHRYATIDMPRVGGLVDATLTR
jgi:hypothetical protein